MIPDRPEAGAATDSRQFLREAEGRRLSALVEADMAVAESLHADGYQLITPGGAALGKEAYLGGVASGRLRYSVFEPATEIEVVAGIDLSCLRYQARIEILVDGEPDRGRFWHTDLWVRNDHGWQALWSHATRIPG